MELVFKEEDLHSMNENQCVTGDVPDDPRDSEYTVCWRKHINWRTGASSTNALWTDGL